MTDIENTVLGIVQDTADYLDEPVLLSSRFMDIGINSVLFIKIIVNVDPLKAVLNALPVTS